MVTAALLPLADPENVAEAVDFADQLTVVLQRVYGWSVEEGA